MRKGTCKRIMHGSVLFFLILAMTFFSGAAIGATNPYGTTITEGMWAQDGDTDKNDGTISTTSLSTYYWGMRATNGSTINNRYQTYIPYFQSARQGTIITTSDYGHGMWAEQNSTANNDYRITTSGNYAYGMYATGGSTINNNFIFLVDTYIRTSGLQAHGMVAEGGSIANNYNRITTFGNYAYGMYATGGSTINNTFNLLESPYIRTSGLEAHGMVAEGSGSQAWNFVDVLTTGESAYGMWATDGSQAYNIGMDFFGFIVAGSIETEGEGSHGMVADGLGSIAANVGSIDTSGMNAMGMKASGLALALNVGSIETSNTGSVGMGAEDVGLALNLGDIKTEGEGAHGMQAKNFGLAVNLTGLPDLDGLDIIPIPEALLDILNLLELFPGEIVTTGYGAHGMYAKDFSIAANLGDIFIRGDNPYAYGMLAEDFSLALNMGNIEIGEYGNENMGGFSHGMGASNWSAAINAGSITTYPYEGAYGMLAENNSIVVNAGSLVSLGGDFLSGMIPGDPEDPEDENPLSGIIDFVAGIFGGGTSTIETFGSGSHGMVARNWSIVLNLDEIITQGNESYGIDADHFSTALNLGSIITYGTDAYGMKANDYSLAANLSSDSIETSGDKGIGMIADNFSMAFNAGSLTTHGLSATGMFANNNSIAINGGSLFELGGDFVEGLDSDFLGGSIPGIYDSLFGEIGSSTIRTFSDGSHGMVAENFSAALNFGDIITHGEEAVGMYASDHSLVVNTGSIKTGSDEGYFEPTLNILFAKNGQGSYYEFGSHGMVAEDYSTALNFGTIVTEGDNNLGMLAYNNSLIANIDTETIETFGDFADGMVADTNSMAINTGSILTHGDYAAGMHAVIDSLALNFGDIETEGVGSYGMVAKESSMALNTGSIITHGDNAFGMWAYDHSLAVNTGSIRTGLPEEEDGLESGPENYGSGSHGMEAGYYSMALNFGTIITEGYNNLGMLAFDHSLISNIDTETIETWGDWAHGMVADTYSMALNTGSVITHGEEAYGMFALHNSMAANTGSITTHEFFSHGMVAEDGSIAANIGSIETEGESAHGMWVKDSSVALNLGFINTYANYAYGIYVWPNSEAVNFGKIETEGSRSFGMFAVEGSNATNFGRISTTGEEAHGMHANSDSNAINFSRITTTGYKACGIVASDGSTATNNGLIDTSGEMAYGLQAYNGSTAENNGLILTSGYWGYGMVAAYTGSEATNRGFIVTSGGKAAGMLANEGSIYNEGVIFTKGVNAHGMYALFGSEVENSGFIITDDIGSHGMYALNSSYAYNNGIVVTLENDSYGMYADNVSSADNYGIIYTHGSGSHGMAAMYGSQAFNYGDIVTSGDCAVGMYAFSKSEIYNYGADTIETLGMGSTGMYASDGSYAYNSGTVITHGADACGMWASDGSTADNYGIIETYGNNAHGMYLSEGSTGLNAGSIITNGAGSDAVAVDDSSLTNMGVLNSVFGSAVSASNGSYVEMLDGTVLAGSHVLSGDITSDLVVSMDQEISVQVKGFELFTKRGTGTMLVEAGSFTENMSNEEGTLEIEQGSQFVVNNDFTQLEDAMLYLYANPDSYADLDTIPLWVQNHASISGGLTADMSTATMPGFYTFIRAETYDADFDTFFVNVDPSLETYTPQWITGGSFLYTSMIGYSFSEAALGLVAAIDDWSMLRWVMANHLQDVADSMNEMETGETKIHAQALAGNTKHDPSSELAAGFDSTRKGLSLGIDQKKSEDTMWGLYAGYTEGEIDFTNVPMAASDWENQDTWHLGGYISKRVGKWILSDTLTYRSTDHDTFRAQAGGDATASFDSWAVTNDIRAGYVAKEIGEDCNWQIIPEIGLNVGYFDRGGYSEKNGFTYGDFDTTVVESVLGIRFRGEYIREDGSMFVPQFRLAWVHVLSGEDITINQSWGGDEHWFTENLDDNYFVADIGMSLYNRNNMDISLNYNGRFSSNSSSHGGWLRFQWEF